MTRVLLRGAAIALALSSAPASSQQGVKTSANASQEKSGSEKSGPERSTPEKRVQDRPASPPVIGCPSLANYRLLMRRGASAAAVALADPKADHLGCMTLPRGRVTGVADRVALGAQNYDCASVQGTNACQWMEAGTVLVPATRSAR